jgi:hypothetical protein
MLLRPLTGLFRLSFLSGRLGAFKPRLHRNSNKLLYWQHMQRYKVDSNDFQSHCSLWTLPSCSRKTGLFGLVVSDLREAWQSVSTISRLKLEWHKHPLDATKTIQAFRECMYDLPIFFLSKNIKVLPKICLKNQAIQGLYIMKVSKSSYYKVYLTCPKLWSLVYGLLCSKSRALACPKLWPRPFQEYFMPLHYESLFCWPALNFLLL